MENIMTETKILTEKMIDYLNTLRESGVINMFVAGHYLESEFDLSRREARQALMEWVESF